MVKKFVCYEWVKRGFIMRKIHKDTQAEISTTPEFDREYLLKSYIQLNIDGVPAKYTYSDEKGINPAFQRIEEVTKLSNNDKRIFALRSDFILATGIKNAEQEHGYQGLEDAFDEINYKFINWKDRYGHPSLVGEGENVFYAGFVCQRNGYLQVFLSSGRYNRCDRESEGIYPLTTEEILIIEAYLAIKFQKAYGIQDVAFYDTTPDEDAKDTTLFFTNKPFPQYKYPRVYNEKAITKATQVASKCMYHEAAQRYIRTNIDPVKPKYLYEGENSINPAYQDIASVEKSLIYHEKRIWALRRDFILATGIKNAYEKEYGYTGFKDGFHSAVYPYIDWEDRYGHTSLTFPDGDGSAYYAGYICQEKGFLQVYLVSGRYERTDLSKEQTSIIEAYIALQFITVYGKQEVEFVVGDSEIPSFHATFFSDGKFGEDVPKRRYNLKIIKSILSDIPVRKSELTLLDFDKTTVTF